MPSRGLSPDTMLSIQLDAICSRNRYTQDPAPVIEGLRAAAGDRIDILTESVGIWVGFFDDDYVHTLCEGLRELPGLEPRIAEGSRRRSLKGHTTPALGIRHA
ncbi:hypothetical protein HWD99_04410 [Microbacterium sp. C5A9]|uniref:hypothetical protein n=1 Tax=Microbacterium sp. C5A9 TaxID=2736663 RepID=UPI001F529B2B|nr:hypothetical protein [Microbacterium sp. C5A9]MCI1017862.1 hypothetical protein [Microbacterium sp. C5A9]